MKVVKNGSNLKKTEIVVKLKALGKYSGSVPFPEPFGMFFRAVLAIKSRVLLILLFLVNNSLFLLLFFDCFLCCLFIDFGFPVLA